MLPMTDGWDWTVCSTTNEVGLKKNALRKKYEHKIERSYQGRIERNPPQTRMAELRWIHAGDMTTYKCAHAEMMMLIERGGNREQSQHCNRIWWWFKERSFHLKFPQGCCNAAQKAIASVLSTVTWVDRWAVRWVRTRLVRSRSMSPRSGCPTVMIWVCSWHSCLLVIVFAQRRYH